MIVPTIGRQVWFRPCAVAAGVMTILSDQPCAATVIHVTDERCVSLSVLDHRGHQHVFAGVKLLQDDDQPPVDSNYAEWMPYQARMAHAVLDVAHPVHTGVAAMNTPVAAKDATGRVFIPGDTVQLNSGGPGMTVENVSGNKVLCSWHNGRTVDRAVFDPAALTLVR